MRDESFSKSRMYYDGILPGNIYTLENNAFGLVVGAGNNEEDLKDLDEIQLLDVTRKILREWDAMNNAEVDQSLMLALDQPGRSIRVMSPESVYVEPFPMMLQCRKCKVLDFHAPFLSPEERAQKASKRIRNVDGRPRVTCKRCNGTMVQMRYVTMHRCGYLNQMDVPFAAGRVENLGYRDKGGSFVQNAFFNVDTGVKTDHALQRGCTECARDYPGLDGSSKRATPVVSRDKFYPHNIQYLCLNRETGRLVSKVSSVVGPPDTPLNDNSRDIAEGIFAALIGKASGTDLVDHMRDVLGGDGPNKDDVEQIREDLESNRKTLAEMEPLLKTLTEEVRRDMTAALTEKIEALEKRLMTASGRYALIRDYISDDGLLQQLAARRRSSESALLSHDFRQHRKDLAEQVSFEMNPLRKDRITQDMKILKTQYGVEDIIHYKEINVVLASIGYSREKATPADDGANSVPVKLMGYEDTKNSSLAGKRMIYAMPAKTEAIQIRLDPCRVLAWCVEAAGWSHPGKDILTDEHQARAHLLKNSLALSLDPAEVKAATKHAPASQSAPFHLLHTISHCLLGTIKRHTGYDEKSVMEYLMPMDLSFILYVTSVQNFTAGGLLTLFKHYLREWFDDASNYAFNCIFDPICSDKGSSCSGCVQTVVGCETFNYGLSRCFVHGGVLDTKSGMNLSSGYWN